MSRKLKYATRISEPLGKAGYATVELFVYGLEAAP